MVRMQFGLTNLPLGPCVEEVFFLIDLLIIDDEYQIREGISKNICWEAHGIRICGTASSAVEALDMFNLRIPDIIITDIKMPGMDGLEFIELMNEKYPNVKVILISGYDDFQYTQKAIELNVFYYLLKPIDDRQLLSKVLEAKKSQEDQYARLRKDAELRRKFDEYVPILKDNFFNRLIGGKIHDAQILKNHLNNLDLKLDAEAYCVLVLELEDFSDPEQKSLPDRSYIRFAVLNRANTVYSQAYTCFTFNMDEKVGVLVLGGSIQRETLKMASRSLKEWVNHTLSICMTIAIGGTYGELLSAANSYRECAEALKLKFLTGRNSVIDLHDFSPEDHHMIGRVSLEQILQASHEDLIFAFKTGNYPEAKRLLDDALSGLNEYVKSNIQGTDRYLFYLSYLLTKILVSLELFIEDFVGEKKDLFSSLKKQTTLEDVAAFIETYFKRIMAELEKKQNTQNNHLVTKALDFINKNIYGDISLTKVATMLYIHPNYLSRIFKQSTGESFVEYLTKVKMNEAKKLLKSSHHKVYEIADMLHYKDVSHFTRVFKTMFVISPNEYRNTAGL